MGAKKWALNLLLFVLSGPCAFYSHHTTQQSHHHCNNHRHHVICLIALASQTNQGYIAESKGLRSLQRTHFLCFKVIRDIVQVPWVYLNCFNAHLLSLPVVGNKKKCSRPNMHYLVPHLLGLILVRNIEQ